MYIRDSKIEKRSLNGRLLWWFGQASET
jgi:hypothetical protein